jgi:hypothetical protein
VNSDSLKTNTGNRHNIGDEVFYVHDDPLKVCKYTIQGIQKEDSYYYDSPVYYYSLEDTVYKKMRNTDNLFIRCFENEIFVSEEEAIKQLNHIKKEKKAELIKKMRSL